MAVGSKTAGASAVGALDMSGNLWEWCEDWYHSDYTGAPSDGSAWVDPSGIARVMRGGSFSYDATHLRSAEHNGNTPADRTAHIGARCVRPFVAATCGGVDCPDMDGPDASDYTASCNAQDHCEYHRQQWTEAWQAYDVWIYVPPGSFEMGSPEAESAKTDERPVQPVTIGTGYFIAKYETPVLAYEACESTGPCTAPSTADWDGEAWGTNRSTNGRSAHPQNGLQWQQAKDFCAWVAPDGRLPSESEWEFAASGPVHRKYPWGDSPDPTCANGTANLNEAGGTGGYGCSTGGTMSVGSKAAGASAVGALDMSGNLWEWCEDWYHDSYIGAPSDGSAWVDPSYSNRVRRGGGFYDDAASMRAAGRADYTPTTHNARLGVRCLRPLP
jgi:formylglycine-generating enzyme required for sulfatase activity